MCGQAESLSAYAVAAADMGCRPWVQQGNAWMLSNIIKFFREGWARKLYARQANALHRSLTGSTMSKDAMESIISSLRLNLMENIPSTSHMMASSSSSSSSSDSSTLDNTNTDIASNPPSDQLIRLLDVGSCYNPFVCGKYPGQHHVEVTALDLFPMHPTVYHCDFLTLRIGSALSAPVVVESPTESAAVLSSSKSLTQLPAGYFDAVCMSLVLSYLPR